MSRLTGVLTTTRASSREDFSMFNKGYSSPHGCAEDFANRLGIRLPVLLAPMAGACPPSLSIAVANAGGDIFESGMQELSGVFDH